jgi:CheY-like chemotaxis protein
MLYTEALLENEPNLSDRAKRFLSIIQSATNDMESTTLRLRGFYRKVEEAELEEIDLSELLQEVIDLTQPRWKDIPQKQGIVIEINTDVQEGLVALTGNKGEIREALTNLVFNAVDAMPNGGRIILHARGDNSHIIVEVIDNGMGMDEEQKAKCLAPFFTTKGEKGSGLGLSMVYGVMQRSGGSIEIDSEPNRGTTARLLFPIKPVSNALTEQGEKQMVSSSLHILCIDDDEQVREALREILVIDGHVVEVSSSGEEGLQLFQSKKESNDPFDLVITDLGMPHIDGHQVAREIKGKSIETPVILLSGWGNFMNLNGELPENIDCVLGKPPRITLLRNAIHGLMSNSSQEEGI